MFGVDDATLLSLMALDEKALSTVNTRAVPFALYSCMCIIGGSEFCVSRTEKAGKRTRRANTHGYSVRIFWTCAAHCEFLGGSGAAV